ncbi:MAG: nucleoside triphosphate pyrophosphohydrolase [Chloroflexota bacterium]
MESFDTLVDTIKTLRSPDGCPWDRAQDHLTVKNNLLEESYEVVEAIDAEEPGRLCEELGDLLMQVVFHAQMAAESGDFTIEEVVRGINSKLVRRHPHVFGEVRAKSAAEALVTWNAMKREEKERGESILSGIPKAMPALAYAQAVQRRAAQVGFDWEEAKDIIDKLAEEVAEVKSAGDHRHMVREFGDLLFTLANIGRRLHIDLEPALREANKRFHDRFSHMEQACLERGVSLESLSLEEQDRLWEEAKRATGG